MKLNIPMNYKTLCQELNIPYLAGNQKKAQLKELNRKYNIVKNGTKYTILEEYNDILPPIDNRSITLPNIEFILLFTLSNANGNNSTYFATNKDLLKLCYIINNNYYSILNDKDRYSTYIATKYNFDDSFIEYVDKTYSILKPTIENALNSMIKRKEIIDNVGYKLRKGKNIIGAVLASSELGQEIFRIQGECMKELGVVKYSDFWGSQITKKRIYFDLCDSKVIYNSKNNELWIKRGWDFDGFYQCHGIILNTNKMKWDLEMLVKNRSELNNKIKDKVHSTKVLHDLSYNQIEKWFVVCNDTKGDKEFNIVEDIKKLK